MEEVEALRQENREQRAQITQLIAQIAHLTDRVDELLAVAQRKQRKPPTEKAPAPAPAPVVDADARRAFDERPTAPAKPVDEPAPKPKAWLVRSLYRDDGLSQPEIARRMRHHKSWVCRRLMLVESLEPAVQAHVRLGLLAARAAVALGRLPRGNQSG